jgi:hypothetical protein
MYIDGLDYLFRGFRNSCEEIDGNRRWPYL